MKPSENIEQTYRNIKAVLDNYNIPVPAVLAKLSDRTMFQRTQEFLDRMNWLTNTANLFERWDYVGNHGVTAQYGWRERVPTASTQIIVHADAIEIDLDVYNPDFGVGPAVCHLLEICTPGKTDPFKVAKKLVHRGIYPEMVA